MFSVGHSGLKFKGERRWQAVDWQKCVSSMSIQSELSGPDEMFIWTKEVKIEYESK